MSRRLKYVIAAKPCPTFWPCTTYSSIIITVQSVKPNRSRPRPTRFPQNRVGTQQIAVCLIALLSPARGRSVALIRHCFEAVPRCVYYAIGVAQEEGRARSLASHAVPRAAHPGALLDGRLILLEHLRKPSATRSRLGKARHPIMCGDVIGHRVAQGALVVVSLS